MAIAVATKVVNIASQAAVIKENVESLIHEVNLAYNFLLFCNTIELETIVCAKIKTKFINARTKFHLFINTIVESTILIKLFEKAQAYVLGKNKNIDEDIAEIENIIQRNVKQKIEQPESNVPKSFKAKIWKVFAWISDTTTTLSSIMWVSIYASYYRNELNILVTIMNSITTELLNSRISPILCGNTNNILSVSGKLLRNPMEITYNKPSSSSYRSVSKSNRTFHSARSNFSKNSSRASRRSSSYRSARSNFNEGSL